MNRLVTSAVRIFLIIAVPHSAVAFERGYAGRSSEGESDLIAMGARHYDPATGRFLQTDPLGFAADQQYAYGAGNPYLYWDPTGLLPRGIMSNSPLEDSPTGLAKANTESDRVGEGVAFAWSFLKNAAQNYHPIFDQGLRRIRGIQAVADWPRQASYEHYQGIIVTKPEFLRDLPSDPLSQFGLLHEAVHAAQRWVSGTEVGVGSSNRLVNEYVANAVAIDALGVEVARTIRPHFRNLSTSEIALVFYLEGEPVWIGDYSKPGRRLESLLPGLKVSTGVLRGMIPSARARVREALATPSLEGSSR